MKLPKVLSPYRMIRPVEGRHRADVFEALDERKGTLCVVKCVEKSFLRFPDVAALRREFERLSRLSHPHIVRVVDFGEDEERIWLVSEKVEGVPLHRIRPAADERTLRGWAFPLLDALAYLHDRGIIHHDVKPENVLVHPSGDPSTLKLIDLGLAAERYVRREQEGPRGTPGYLAPELSLAGAIDARVDLYAAGRMLGKLAAGRSTAPFSDWLDRMTRENPEERFPSARAARAALRAEGSAEAELEPYLTESLPWARCRNEWKLSLEILTGDSRARALLRAGEAESERFLSSLHAALVAQGLSVRHTAFRDAADITWPPLSEGRHVLLVSELDRSGFAHLERWCDEQTVRTAGLASLLWVIHAREQPPEFAREWKELRIGALRPDEERALLNALHPELLLERPLLSQLHNATKGDPRRLRVLLTRVLDDRPTVERFRQKLIETLAAPAENTLRPPPPCDDPQFHVLAWAGRAMPLEWFGDREEAMSEWGSRGWLHYRETGEGVWVAPAGDWSAEMLPPESAGWLRARLAREKAHPDLVADLALRLGASDVAREAGGKLLRILLRQRRFEKALAWLARLGPVLRDRARAERLECRLLLETTRLPGAKALLEKLPDGPTRKKYLDRLAFLEGRFSECPPDPDILIRLGNYAQAYAAATERLNRGIRSLRRRADWERMAGLSALYNGRTGKAFFHLQKARFLWRKAGDHSGYAATLNQLGMAFAQAKQPKRAARFYRHAAELAVRTGDRRRALSCLLNLGTVQLEMGDLRSALANFERCRTSLRLLGLNQELAYATQNLANFWINVGHPDRAEQYLNEIEETVGHLGARETEIYQTVLKGDVAILRRDSRSLRSLVERLRLRKREAGRHLQAIETLEAEADRLEGRLEAAIEKIRKGKSINQTLLLAEWEFETGRISSDEVEQRYRKLFRGKRDTHFFAVVRRLRFLALLRRATAPGGKELPKDLRFELASLRRGIEINAPPELLGPLRDRLAAWFGDDLQVSEGPASLSEMSEESRLGMSFFLRIANSMTGVESPDRLLRHILVDMMRLVGVPRGGIVLERNGELVSSLFFQRQGREEIGVPSEISRSIIRETIRCNRAIYLPDARNTRPTASVEEHDLRGILCLPLRVEGRPTGAIYLDDPTAPLRLRGDALALAQGVADQAATVLRTADLIGRLRQERERTMELNRKLREIARRQSEKIADLRKRKESPSAFRWERFGILGDGRRLRNVLEVAEKIARSDAPVLLSGEAGTEVQPLARAIWALAGCVDRPFVTVDCATLPDTLFEAELFGYEPGAFTGATTPKPGLVRSADEGALLLDSVSSVPPAVQAKLLRVLQEKRVRPLGSETEIPVSVRVFSTVRGNPRELVRKGLLREDLFFRLAVVELELPPLRERPADIPAIIRHLLGRPLRGENERPKRITRAALDRLQSYTWPGNLDQLRNELERASLLCENDLIDVDDLSDELRISLPQRSPPRRRRASAALERVRGEMEREIIRQALRDSGGRRGVAAQRLGISRITLYRKLKERASG